MDIAEKRLPYKSKGGEGGRERERNQETPKRKPQMILEPLFKSVNLISKPTQS